MGSQDKPVKKILYTFKVQGVHELEELFRLSFLTVKLHPAQRHEGHPVSSPEIQGGAGVG